MKEILEVTTIEEAFPESKFLLFRTFCKRKGIKYIHEFTNEHLEEHAKRKNVGTVKVAAIRQRLNHFLDNEPTPPANVGNISNSRERIDLPANAIENIFAENIFKTFRKFCEKNNIKTVEDLTSKHLQDYSKTVGVGEKKFEAVKQKVNENLRINNKDQKTIGETSKILDTSANSQELDKKEMNDGHSQASIEAVFPYNEFRSFWRFCKQNNIQTISEITEIQLIKYAEMQGVGQARVHAVKQRMDQYIHIYHSPEKSPLKESDKMYLSSICFSAGSKDIRTIFYENKFNLFKRFCARNGIKTVKEITPERLQKFADSKQVGTSRVEEVLQALKEYIEQADAAATKFQSGEHYEVMKEHNVQALLLFYGYNSHSNSNLKVKDIEGKDLVELRDDFDPFLLLELSSSLKKQKIPEEIVTKLTSKFSPREIEILRQRYELGKTLEEVAKNTKLSRERIRQIINDLVKKTSAYLKRERFSNNVHLMSGFKTYVSKEELIQLVGAENQYIINLLLLEKLLFSYFHNMDIFFFENEKKMNLARIDEYIKNLPELFKLDDYFRPMEEMLESIGIENPSLELVHNILESGKYTKYGEIYTDQRLTVIEAVTYLFKNYITGPFRIDAAGVGYLQDLAKRHLEYELSNSVKAVEARIRDAEKLLLVGRSTFEYFDDENFNKTIILEIEEYVNQEFKGREMINVEELFETFEESLFEVNIKNKIQLYSVMKYFLDDKFMIGHGNTLNIYKNKKSKPNIYISGYDLNSFVKVIAEQFPTQLTTQEIKQFAEKHGFNNSNALLKRLIEDGLFIEIDLDKLYNTEAFPFTDSTLEKLKRLIEEKMGNDQYLSISHFKGYEHILPPVGFFWNPFLLKSFLERCGFRQVKKLKHDHRYDKVIMVKEESHIKTFEDLLVYIMQKEFTGLIQESKVYDFLAKKGILREQENPDKKVLPQEIKISEKFIFAKTGRVAVK